MSLAQPYGDISAGSPADAYAAALPGGPAGRDVEEFDLTGLDRVGVPFWTVTLHADAAAGRPKFGGQGFGIDPEAARTGAYGELTEEWRSWAALSVQARRAGSYRELLAELGRDGVVDPRTLCLEAGSDYDHDRPLQWLPMRRLRLSGAAPELGEDVLVPAEFVASNPGDLVGDAPPGGWLTTFVTNGLGAGPDLGWAVAHGLLELLQRDGNGLRFRAMDAGVDVDLDGLADLPALEVLRRLRAAGVEPRVKLASTDFGIPNVYAVGPGPADDVPIMTTACGEGIHPDRERAVRKALLEYAASRARKVFMHGPLDRIERATSSSYLERAVAALDLAGEEHRALAAMVEWLQLSADELRDELAGTVLSSRSTVAFGDLPSTPAPSSTSELPALLLPRLAAGGFHEVLVTDLSPADGPVAAAKVLVPGLEVETMSYGRIGERNLRRLVEAGRDDLAWIGTSRPGAARVHLTEAAEQRLGGAGWVDRTALDRVVGRLYPLYREPSRHAAPLTLARSGAAT